MCTLIIPDVNQNTQMNVSGTTIAVSEVLKLKERCIVIIKLHNSTLDVVFHILIQDSEQFKWKDKVAINEDYIFTHLKLNVVNKGTPTELTLLMTTPDSSCYEQKEDNIQLICNDDLANISHLFDCKNSSVLNKEEVETQPVLITYDGFVTDDSKAHLGLYELDNKVILCTSFMMWSSEILQLHKGDKIIVYNVHVLKGFMEQTTLVCCGLSSIRLLESNISDRTRNLSCQLYLLYFARKLNLNFKEFLWLIDATQMLLYKLSPMFLSEEDLLTSEINSSIFNKNILSIHLKCRKLLGGITSEIIRDHSAFQEFTSEPHTCFNNSKSQNLLTVQFPAICDIISLARTKAVQLENSAMWKHSVLECISKNSSMILVGVLDGIENGNLIIKDQTGLLLCHLVDDNQKELTEMCTCTPDCPCGNSMFPYKHIIGVKNFQVVTEHISKFNKKEEEIMYIQCSLSSVVLLKEWKVFDLSTHEEVVSRCKLLKIHDMNITKTFDTTVENPSLMFQNNNLVKAEIQSSSAQSGYNCCDKVSMANTELFFCQKFMVISKCLPLIANEDHLTFQVNICLFGEAYVEAFKSNADENHFSLVNEECGQLRQECNIQTELKDSIFKQKVLKFNNTNARNYSILSPYYLYLLEIPLNQAQNVNRCEKGFLNKLDQCHWWKKWNEDGAEIMDVPTKARIFQLHQLPVKEMKTIKEICILHDTDRKLYSSYQVKEIISKKCQIGDRCRVVGKVVDKKYCGDDLNLCVKLQDETCDDVVYIYFPTTCSILGLLPSCIVDLRGMKVYCSQMGNIYLKAVFPYESNIVKSGGFVSDTSLRCSTFIPANEPIVPWNLFSKVSQRCKMKSLSFIVRILHVKLHFTASDDCNSAAKAEAKFLVDDGSGQAIVFCKDENVQQLLKLTKSEWELFKDFVLSSGNNLIYECTEEQRPLQDCPIEVQLFYVVCHRNSLRRQVVMECRAYFSQDGPSTHSGFPRLSLYCIALTEPVIPSVSRDFLAHLKKQMR